MNILPGLQIWPLALFAGLAFTIPYALRATFLGSEFPSLFRALIGLPIVIYVVKKNYMPLTRL